MNPAFPPALAGLIAQMLEGVSRKELAARAQQLSAAYRAGQASHGMEQGDVLAYLLARAPATFAAISAVLARVKEVAPDFAPQSLLDVGAGPGTASWAAQAQFASLSSVTMLEANGAFRLLAAKLVPGAHMIAGDVSRSKPKSDLVIAAYLLAELPEKSVAMVARDVWASAAQMLVLVEPGTPQGFARIRAARAALIEAGAHVAAPCTHDNACPMSGSDWCHFSQRLQRSRDHMHLKDASVPFEDERYSYVVAMREKLSSGARIIKPVLKGKPGLTLPLCDESGLRNQFIVSRDKQAYRAARKLGWGDLFFG